MKQFISLMDKLKFQFNNIDLLKEALTHPSLKYNKKYKFNDYERLELLGDSILNFIITEFLYNNFKENTEGELSKIRSYLVSKEILNKIAEELDIGQYILMTKGEEMSGGRSNSSNLENCVESLMAAIYIDSRDIAVVRNIILNLWQYYFDNFDIDNIDPKTTLQEWSQSKKLNIPQYNLIKQEGLDHAPIFTIEVKTGDYSEIAKSGSIKEASKKAAQNLLEKIKNDE